MIGLSNPLRLQLMRRWKELALRVNQHFKCKRCADCCQHSPAQFTDKEVARLCKHLGIGFEEFERKYLDPNAVGIFLKTPCPFLEGNSCAIYEVRPLPCRLFPFNLDDFTIAACPLGLEIISEIVRLGVIKKILLPQETAGMKEVQELLKKVPKSMVVQTSNELSEEFSSAAEWGAFQRKTERERKDWLPVHKEIRMLKIGLPLDKLETFVKKLERSDTVK